MNKERTIKIEAGSTEAGRAGLYFLPETQELLGMEAQEFWLRGRYLYHPLIHIGAKRKCVLGRGEAKPSKAVLLICP